MLGACSNREFDDSAQGLYVTLKLLPSKKYPTCHVMSYHIIIACVDTLTFNMKTGNTLIIRNSEMYIPVSVWLFFYISIKMCIIIQLIITFIYHIYHMLVVSVSHKIIFFRLGVFN